MKYRTGDVILCKFEITDVDRITGHIFVRGVDGGPNIVVTGDDIVKLESRAFMVGDTVAWRSGKLPEYQGKIVAIYEDIAWCLPDDNQQLIVSGKPRTVELRDLTPVLNPGAPKAGKPSPHHSDDDDDDDDDEEFYHNKKGAKPPL